MPDARINLSVSGQSQVSQALSEAERGGARVRANTAATLQNTLDVVRATTGQQLDPSRSRADLAALRQVQQQNAREVARLNQDAPERREQLASRRAALEERAGQENERRAERMAARRAAVQEKYQQEQNRIATRGADMEASYQAKGGTGTPRVLEKWMSSQTQDLEQWHEGEQQKLAAEAQSQGPGLSGKALEKAIREEQEYEQTLRGANEGLVEFAQHMREFADLAGRIERGEVDPGEAVPATRDLGHLEKLRLEENVLKSRLSRASENELPGARKALQAKQKEIDDAAGGTDRSAGQRQLAESINGSVQRALMGVGGAVGGAIGQTLGAGIQVVNAGREAATLDPVKAIGGVVALAAVSAAALAGLVLPRGKELEASTNRLAGVGGVRPDDRTFGTNVTYQAGQASLVGGEGQSVVEALAMDRAQFRDYARGIALSSGSVRGLEGRATAQLTYERAFGLDQGQLSSVGAEGYRQKGTMEGNIAQMLSIFQRSGIINVSDKGLFDTARLGETIARANSLTDVQKSRFAKADPAMSARLIAAGERVGGMFTGSTGNGTMLKLDQAIRQPGNEYAQAATFRALGRPGDDLYDVQRRQEAGIFDGGDNYSRIYDFLSKKNGGKNDKRFRMDLAAYTGFDLRTTEQLAAGGRSAMMGVGSEKDFAAKYGSATFQGRAIDQTGDLSKLDTMLVNKLQIMGLDGKDMLVEGAKHLGIDLRTKEQMAADARKVAAAPRERIAVGNGNYQDAMAVEQAKRMAEIGKTLREGTLKVHVVNPPALAAPGATTPRKRN